MMQYGTACQFVHGKINFEVVHISLFFNKLWHVFGLVGIFISEFWYISSINSGNPGSKTVK